MLFKASLPFTAFVVWLLSVPMEGFLLVPLGVRNALLFFLVPHVTILLAIGTVCPRRFFFPLAVAGGAVAAGATLLLPHFPAAAPWLLVLAGVGAAFLVVLTGVYLKRSPSMAVAAALGLAAANLFLFFFSVIPLSDRIKFPLAAVLLLVPTLMRSDAESQDDGESNLLWFLPFVFVFQIVSGLMYGILYGHYARAALFPGAELFFYVFAVGGGLPILRRRREWLLALAIVTAMFAFSLYLLPGIVPVNAAMFAMQGAAGFLDLYLLALLLAQRDAIRAFGCGLAAGCSGIALGKVIALAIGDASQMVVAAANLTLTLSVLLLYRVMQREQGSRGLLSPAVAKPTAVESFDAPEAYVRPAAPLVLPPGLRKRFSEQEKSVLACVARGMTFREAARELVISESSVKTYMKRIYDKMSVSGKEELLVKLRALNAPSAGVRES
jgi:DNA-binding NarL/FixJ family response regulator